MSARTPRAAVHEYVGPLQLALSCVTPAVVGVSGGYYPRAEPHVLILGDGRPVRLAGGSELSLWLRQHYRIVPDRQSAARWTVDLAGYMYSLNDAAGREILAYHWHPEGRSRITEPHLHLGKGADVRRTELADAHLSTGNVTLDEILLLAITEFGVRPIRADWHEILTAS